MLRLSLWHVLMALAAGFDLPAAAPAQDAPATAVAVAVDADYPGGNVIVEKIDGDVVQLRPDLRDTAG